MDSATYSRIENGKVVGEAILYMKSRPPNPDGTIGFIVRRDMREWLAWEAYFETNGMTQQLAFMRTCKDGYMVPAQLPMQFDPSWRYQPKPQKQGERQSREMTAEERDEVIRRVTTRVHFKPAKAGRYAQEDARVEARPMPVARDLTEAERASMARLLGERREAAE